MNKHTQTPWINHGQCIGTPDSKKTVAILPDDESPAKWGTIGGFEYGDLEPDAQAANCARIVACVNACAGINPEAVPDLLTVLRAAVARVELANREGDPILSAWLPDAQAAIAKAEGR